MGLYSFRQGQEEIKKYILEHYDSKCTILDIGAGDGNYYDLLGEHFTMDAVEVFEPWAEKYKLKEKYREVFITNILDFNFEWYDIIIMGDILEHIPTDQAQKLFNHLYPKCHELLIAVPYKHEQHDYNENKYQVHHQDDLTKEIFLERYPNMQLLYPINIDGLTAEGKKLGGGYFIKRRNDYKIAIYTIAKNEEKFVDKWMDSMQEADYVVVLDTGSTDRTVEKLRARGAIVHIKEIKPWRFDVARNESLKIVPEDADILFSTDLDEVLEPGWAAALRESWNDDATRRTYKYSWSHNEDGSNDRVFWYDKIHSNHEWYWEFPVHERLVYKGTRPQQQQRVERGIFLHHYPDLSKSRGSYLKLLQERAVETDYKDYYGLVYLADEYYYSGDVLNSLATYKMILNMPEAVGNSLIATNLNNKIGKRYQELEQYDKAIEYCKKAIESDSRVRDSYATLASIYIDLKEYRSAIYWLKEALNKTVRLYYWVELGKYWKDAMYDMLGLAYYYAGDYESSLVFFDLAIEAAPYKERLKVNRKFALDRLKEQYKFTAE